MVILPFYVSVLRVKMKAPRNFNLSTLLKKVKVTFISISPRFSRVKVPQASNAEAVSRLTWIRKAGECQYDYDGDDGGEFDYDGVGHIRGILRTNIQKNKGSSENFENMMVMKVMLKILTLAISFKPGCCVDCVPEKAISRHLHAHHTRTAWS